MQADNILHKKLKEADLRLKEAQVLLALSEKELADEKIIIAKLEAEEHVNIILFKISK